jgi:hypothetical protein
LAVIADPVLIRKLFNAITTLMNWNVAQAAKYNHIFIFVISTITYHTLRILLATSLSGIGIHTLNRSLVKLFRMLELVQDFAVFIIILPLLNLFHAL